MKYKKTFEEVESKLVRIKAKKLANGKKWLPSIGFMFQQKEAKNTRKKLAQKIRKQINKPKKCRYVETKRRHKSQKQNSPNIGSSKTTCLFW